MLQEIEILETIVHVYLDDQITKTCSTENIISEIGNLEIPIRKSLILLVSELRNDSLIEFHIQEVQRRFLWMINRIYKTGSNADFRTNPQTGIDELKPTLLRVVNNLLHFLENSFPKYIHQDCNIHEILKDESIAYFKDQLTWMETCFEGQNKDLLRIALHPIKEFVVNKQPISYHHLKYLQLLISELTNAEIHLKERLIKLNFNSLFFLHSLTREIENDLEATDSYSGKMEKLFWNLKWIKQIQLSDNVFYTSRKSIKELLIDWINEEISYLEKLVTLEKLNHAVIETSQADKEFKLITDLSVAQLGFLIRVFMDSGLFKNENHRAVAKFFATHTKTKGSSAISSGNLLNKFYDVSGNVESAVKGIIINMLNQIQKY
jgi:hypothetical protein